jgi:hypothetical protein
MKRTGIAIAFLFFGLITAQAQKAAQPTISDDDLKKYALTMDSVKGMQETLIKIITENVQKNTVMSVTRYNELYKVASDSTKLAAANITNEEKAFLAEIADLNKFNNERINKTFQALAKDYVGLKSFNAIKKGLDADPKLKARYDEIKQQIQSSKGTIAPKKDSQGK